MNRKQLARYRYKCNYINNLIKSQYSEHPQKR